MILSNGVDEADSTLCLHYLVHVNEGESHFVLLELHISIESMYEEAFLYSNCAV